MFMSLHSSSTVRGSVITIIQSLPIRNCLLYICSTEFISNPLKSKTYLLLWFPNLTSYQEGVSKCTPLFFTHKTLTFPSRGFVLKKKKVRILTHLH